MKYPQIHCILDKNRASLIDYLRNLGALAADYKSANIILTDDINQLRKGRLCFLIADESVLGHIHIPRTASHQKVYETIIQVVSAIQNFDKADEEQSTPSVSPDEAAIVGGFARHFSHNVLNSLLAVGCFLRQLKPLTDDTEHSNDLWKIVDNKLRLIEELVNGYNDYNHVLDFKVTEEIEVSSFYHDLVVSITDKTFGKAFSAYLGYYTDRYEMTCDFQNPIAKVLNANPLFLKQAFCYIMKDTIQYLGAENEVINFHVVTESREEGFCVNITVKNISIPPEILKTMFTPWHHQMFAQSFDYWGLAIAQTIIGKHGGKFTVENTEKDLIYKVKL